MRMYTQLSSLQYCFQYLTMKLENKNIISFVANIFCSSSTTSLTEHILKVSPGNIHLICLYKLIITFLVFKPPFTIPKFYYDKYILTDHRSLLHCNLAVIPTTLLDRFTLVF